MKIAFIPIDNRPVCYQMPKMISEIDKNLEFFIPGIGLLGDLTRPADTDGLLEWLKSLPEVDAVILSLDTVAYGGLIPSRRSEDSFDAIKERIFELKSILISKKAKIYAFSSIMRISNNNINEEEKQYWNLYGTEIFRYSYNYHKLGETKNDIPKNILEDYLDTRKRNFEINKIYLEWQKEGFFDTLIFSKDDCAEFGLNVMEARELEALGGFTKTGADEIPLTLLARAITKKIKVAPIFLEPEYKNLISNYEDISIEKSVEGQLTLAGCEIVDETNADILLYINNFEEYQGEIVMKRDTKHFHGIWKRPDKPYIIADVRIANGADNEFVRKIFDVGVGDNFLGYSGWNTSANTLGSLICSMKTTYNSDKNNAFKKLQVVRFLDDWAYQANVRQALKSTDVEELKDKMCEFEQVIKKVLNIDFSTSYSFPWNRLFEVKIEFN